MPLVGVDLGTRKVAWAVFDDDGDLITTGAFIAALKASRGDQLRAVAETLRDVVEESMAEWVFIETIISGNNRKYSLQLAQVIGACLSELSTLDGVRVETVDNKVWKKHVIGNGNADKERIRIHVREHHRAYAALCGDDQDQYDATCVGLYGVALTRRARGLQLEVAG